MLNAQPFHLILWRLRVFEAIPPNLEYEETRFRKKKKVRPIDTNTPFAYHFGARTVPKEGEAGDERMRNTRMETLTHLKDNMAVRTWRACNDRLCGEKKEQCLNTEAEGLDQKGPAPL